MSDSHPGKKKGGTGKKGKKFLEGSVSSLLEILYPETEMAYAGRPESRVGDWGKPGRHRQGEEEDVAGQRGDLCAFSCESSGRRRVLICPVGEKAEGSGQGEVLQFLETQARAFIPLPCTLLL